MTKLKLNIRPRLIVLFVTQIVIIFAVAGFYLQQQIRNQLEGELGRNLETVAKLTSQQMEGEILANISPGDEGTRSYSHIVNSLQTIRSVTAMSRIFIFDMNYRSLADTKAGIPIGWTYVHLKFDQQELKNVFQGRTASSILFTGEDGRLYKSGYAPVLYRNEVVAVVRVEGSAETMESIGKMKSNLLTLGIVAVLGSIVLAVFFSNRITRPLKQLQKSAMEIGRGDYHQSIVPTSQDEVGFLASTLNDMRRNIIHRDVQQKAMLAGVAHEIRNPLGGIELFAGILSDELPEGEMRDRAMKILKEVKNLKSIVKDFLNYARPPQPQRQVCSPKEIFDGAKSLLGNELKGIQLNFAAAEEDLRIMVDPQHIKQVFMNMMKNSIAARGNIDVQIKKGANGRIIVVFADDGVGVREEDRSKIFNPFFTTHEKGVGLGLAIVKNLVEANGGQIELIQEVKKGAAFSLNLPAADLK